MLYLTNLSQPRHLQKVQSFFKVSLDFDKNKTKRKEAGFFTTLCFRVGQFKSIFPGVCFLFDVQVKFSVWFQYVQAMGWGYAFWALFIYIIQNVAFIGQNLWLSDWTNDAVEHYNQTYSPMKRDTRVGVFGALGMTQGN